MKRGLLLALAIFASGILNAVEYQGLEEKRHIAGPELTAEDLQDKVVFFEYWGINCPPCRESFPHLVDVWKKYEKTGKFVMFASHMQGPETDKIMDFLSKNKVEFSVYQMVQVPGLNVQGIPHAALIDHTGKIVAQGHPSQLYSKVGDLVKAAPDVHFILGTLELKFNKAVVNKLAYGKNIENVMAELEKKTDAATPAAEEAKTILERCRKWLNAEKTRIDKEVKTHPSQAFEEIADFKKMCPSDTMYDATYAGFKTDRQLQSLITLRNEIKKEVARWQKSPKPSKAVAARFRNLKKRLDPISAEPLATEVKAVAEDLDRWIKTTSPE